MSDPCNIFTRKIKTYKPPTLVEPTVSNSSYQFKEKDRTYTYEYYRNEQKVEGGCKYVTSDCLMGVWSETFISIKDVTMMTPGFCSKSVAYMLKVLLMESAKVNEFPYEGHVYIVTTEACKAVNCYTHAFQMNKFEPNGMELRKFRKENNKRKKNESIYFKFTGFCSVEQKKKYDEARVLKL
tara:strand:- start:5179 stop:5724 length:546 start_codon:yes stop_codon:yes gene_type:complete